jgi:hypothetical protein
MTSAVPINSNCAIVKACYLIVEKGCRYLPSSSNLSTKAEFFHCSSPEAYLNFDENRAVQNIGARS